MKNKPNTLSDQIGSSLYRTLLTTWGVLAVLVIIGVLSFYHIDGAYTGILNQVGDLQSYITELNTAIVSEMLNTRAFLISGEEAAITSRQLNHEDIERDLSKINQLLATQPDFKIPSLATLVQLHQEYDHSAAQMIELARSGKRQEAVQMFDAQSDPLVFSMQTASHNIQNELQQGLLKINNDYSDYTRHVILIVGIFFVLCSGLVAIFMLHRISSPLRALDYFENTLSNADETQIYGPIEALAINQAHTPHLFDTYNRLTQRLMESNNAILKYVSFLHHEINSLLASVAGYGSMLADPALRPDDADSEEYGKIIVQQARRITFLVEDFSLGAKIEANQYHPVLMPTNVTPLLASLVVEMREESQREIILNGAIRPILLLADALSLEKALRKVIENALKFSPAGTPVEVTLDASRSSGYVEICVQDHGIGIDPSDVPLLYHPFSRVLNEATKRIPGNGMGLYLADAIIRAHHGRIRLRSQSGTGSTFILSLPVKQ